MLVAKPLKLAFSSSQRRFHLGVNHTGAAAPVVPLVTAKQPPVTKKR